MISKPFLYKYPLEKNMKMNKVIVLPGAESQIPLVQKLKGLGYHVTVFNPYENSPAFSYADDYKLVDILDKEKCLQYAREIHPQGVFSDMCDIAMPTVAFLSESLGLYSLGKRCASLYTDKWEMRMFCEKHNLPSPRYKLCHTADEAHDFFDMQDSKCIIKPLDSNSSRGVFTIEKSSDIDLYFPHSIAFSKCKKAVLVEQYIDGTEFTVDGIMTTNGHRSLAISEKKHYEHNKNIAYELYFSHDNPMYDYNLLRETNDKYVNLSDLPVGCFTHAEYKWEHGKFYLIEIGARGGGNFISSDIVPCMTGLDNYQALIDSVISQCPIDAHESSELKNRCAVLYFFDVEREGVVSSIENEEILKDSRNILRYKFNFQVGDTIKKAENDAARIGYYIAYADTRKELVEFMSLINSKVVINVR